MGNMVSFRHRPGTKVYYLKNDKPAWGYVKQVEITIDRMDRFGTCEPRIRYNIAWDWYNESELYTDKDLFKTMYQARKKTPETVSVEKED